MSVVAVAAALVLLLWTSLLYAPLRWRPVWVYLMMFKLYALAFAPFIALFGIALSLIGALSGSWWIAAPAGVAALGAFTVVVRLGSVRSDLAGVLGANWEEQIPPGRRTRMVGRWWRGRLPSAPEPRWRRNVPFAAIPGRDRILLCDVWQPPLGCPASGVAVVYLHGSAYMILDKDVGTRPLFRHLAAQGHVVVDVAYRLFPETDLPGMVADAKRAVEWCGHGLRTSRSIPPGLCSRGDRQAAISLCWPGTRTKTRP